MTAENEVCPWVRRTIFRAKLIWSKSYVLKTLPRKETGHVVLETYGALWFLIEIAGWVSPCADQWCKTHFGALALVGLLVGLSRRMPVVSISERIPGRDVRIEIRVCDMFDLKGAYVIGSNTTFDTDMDSGLIAKDSIQGQFTLKHYDGDAHCLDSDLERSLDGQIAVPDPKKPRKKGCYAFGTVAQVHVGDQWAYFVAVAEFNEFGNAISSFPNLQESLPRLWEHITERGPFKPIVMPLLGSGRSRIKESREVIAKEIIRSFIAACATRKFCEKMTLTISPDDYVRYSLDLQELAEFLRYQCRYTQFRSDDRGAGTGISR